MQRYFLNLLILSFDFKMRQMSFPRRRESILKMDPRLRGGDMIKCIIPNSNDYMATNKP
jgi:hypothetical protein